MPADNSQVALQRKKRVQTLKKMIILSLFVVALIPLVLCVTALVRIDRLNTRLDIVAFQLEELQRIAEGQQEQLELLLAQEQNDVGSGQAATAESVDNSIYAVSAESVPQDETIVAAHKVYLTFDDGPSIYTQDILDILDRYDIKATFFVVGKEGESAKNALCEIADRGHSLGLHSYSHKYSQIYASEEAFAEDFERIQKHIFEITGVQSKLYRFPGGSSNTVSKIPMERFAEYLDSMDVSFYDWNASSGDGGKQLLDIETLLKNSMNGIERRETTVILMHDSAEKPTTVEVLPMLIENILALEDTVILPITEDTEPVQHIKWD